MDAVFTAADITGLDTKVTALVVSFVGIGLIFTAWRMARKAGIR